MINQLSSIKNLRGLLKLRVIKEGNGFKNKMFNNW
jgi:hypothetical protein